MKIPNKDLWIIINEYYSNRYKGDSAKIWAHKTKYLQKLVPFFKTKLDFDESFADVIYPDEEKLLDFCNTSFSSWYLFFEGHIYFHRETDAVLFLLKYGEHIR